MRRPLGISIVGGLIVSQMLTLFTTPVVYLYMDRLRVFLGGHESGALCRFFSRSRVRTIDPAYAFLSRGYFALLDFLSVSTL